MAWRKSWVQVPSGPRSAALRHRTRSGRLAFGMPPSGHEVSGRLADLQALTDTALTQLEVEDLLDELLSRVRDILDADTAAVLLLDRGADELVARAARGIEEEVRQGVR